MHLGRKWTEEKLGRGKGKKSGREENRGGKEKGVGWEERTGQGRGREGRCREGRGNNMHLGTYIVSAIVAVEYDLCICYDQLLYRCR